MKHELKRPSAELTECAEALLKASITTPAETLKGLIEEGYAHLRELKAGSRCNPLLVSALEHRINHAEEVLDRQTRLTNDSPRSA